MENIAERLTEPLAEFASDLGFDELPGDVVHEVKRLFLDSVACAIAGQGCGKGEISVRLARRLGGPQESTIIGTGERVSCCNASFANGELINALDWDATCPRHYPPVAIPPALALAECVRAPGKELITAIALALELMARLGATTITRSFDREGQVQTMRAVHGYSSSVFGATAGAGRVLRLDGDKMAHALGIAGHIAPVSGAGKWHRTLPLSMVKYGSTGWLSQAAATAALLAEMGYFGDTTVLDGAYGFWRFSGSEAWHPSKLTEGLGESWAFLGPGVGYKQYPACFVVQAGLDCFTHIINDHSLVPEDIEEVRLWLDPLVEYPCHAKRDNITHIDAQFNFASVMAVAAHRIPAGTAWQSAETLNDPRIRDFARKVTIAPHPQFVRAKMESYGSWLAKVEVVAKRKTFEEEATYPKFARDLSHPTKPGMRDEDLVAKFRSIADGVLPNDRIDRAVESILGLEDLQDIGMLMSWLAK